MTQVFANILNTLVPFPKKKNAFFYSLPALEQKTNLPIHRLPISIRIMLESILRNCDGKKIKEEDVLHLARWQAKSGLTREVPFVVARVLSQDFTGVPLLVDLAAMRDAVAHQNRDPEIIEPAVRVDLVIDHSVQVDRAGTEDAFLFNLGLEFTRNIERYRFLKWGQDAFHTFKVIPPGIGIVHQVNLEYLAPVVMKKQKKDSFLLYPDTLVGTDSHTPMINGLGVLGWGVGGIEAEAAMLGQPVILQMPEVIGVHLSGELKEGVTATDLALRITELLRKEKVVGKFVEFFGEGAASLTVADRATFANMSPEYGATVGFFGIDQKTLDYLKFTGRKEEEIEQIKQYYEAQELFGIPHKGEIDYTKELELNLASVVPSIAGPKRPQDRIPLQNLKKQFHEILNQPTSEGGYGKSFERTFPKIHVHSDGTFSLKIPHETGGKEEEEMAQPVGWSEEEMVANRPFTEAAINPGYLEDLSCSAEFSHGSVVIAAITSCTNTSNPSVMIAAGLVAKKAVEHGLQINPTVKTSLAPGSRVVTDYLEKADLQKYLDLLGFRLVGYGCTTCIGNSGPLDQQIENAIQTHDIVAASVLSGNRNFEARIHSSVKANFLMSPPLVVAFALAGRVDIDMNKEPLGHDKKGKAVFLRDLWPSSKEIETILKTFLKPKMFIERYAKIAEDNPHWNEIEGVHGTQYAWDFESTYIQNPPFFEDFTIALPPQKKLTEMRCLALFGDSVTTDHISPAGAIRADSPAGKYLLSKGVAEKDFNSFGSRRGNHFVMMRGTFGNVRIKNKMVKDKEGGFTLLMPEKKLMPIYNACEIYAKNKTPLIIFAGSDYGMGSSRDWAAKGTALLGIHAVVAKSFERIHRSNLIGMGVLPLELTNTQSYESLGIDGSEIFSITGLNEKPLDPGQEVVLHITRNHKTQNTKLRVRLDTPVEVEYYRNGGILPFVLRQILAQKDH